MSVTLSLDTREFQRAVREYVAATGKDGSEALNRQAKNFAFHCIKATKKTKGAGAIRALANEPWWPKLIAKIVGQQAGGAAASDAYRAQWSAAQKKIRDAAGRKGAWKLTRQESSFSKYAGKLSRQILGKRVSAISFLAFFFKSVVNKMGAAATGKAFNGFSSIVKSATPSRLSVQFDSAYSFRKRGSKTASGSERILQEAMNKGMALTVQDMREYVARKLAARSQQASGRAA